jgi:tetratricopeptide (TPR) repeat protein
MRSLEELDAPGANPRTNLGHAEVESDSRFHRTAVFPAILAEIRLSRGEHGEAFGVLSAGLSRFPDDLRLRQLMGLYWSRQGQLEKALHWLEPLATRFDADDETAGMTAGVYKRKWQADKANRNDLEKAYRAYRDAWKKSNKKNTYLGINSATTALWLGRADEARRVATEVEELLRDRLTALPRDLMDPGLALSFWDQVTLAEAHALQGAWDAAERTWREALARHPERSGDAKVSLKQLNEIRTAQGLPGSIG